MMNKIDELRDKIQPNFSTREELYAYAADNDSAKITPKQAYKELDDNLLPVFKIAKELCEHLSGDKDYFKQEKHTRSLYHMALVSRMVKNINIYGGTEEEKKKSIHLSDPHYRGMVYINGGKKSEEPTPFERKEDKGFKKLISRAGIGCATYDDQLTTIYFGAVKEDISPIFNEKAKVSVSGNFLNWQAAKTSHVLWAATKPFVNAKMAHIAKEKGVAFSKRFDFYQDAETKIQSKIAEFCDIKNKEYQQQLQKGKEAR